MSLISDAEAMLGRPIMASAITALTGDLNERLRVREMEETYRTNPLPVVALPSFFLEALSIDIDGQELSAAPGRAVAQGQFSIVGHELRVITGGKLLTMDYLAQIPPYDEDRANAVYSAYPSLLLYGLLTHHARLARDADGVGAWETAFEAALTKANANYARSKQSQIGSRPAPRYAP